MSTSTTDEQLDRAEKLMTRYGTIALILTPAAVLSSITHQTIPTQVILWVFTLSSNLLFFHHNALLLTPPRQSPSTRKETNRA